MSLAAPLYARDMVLSLENDVRRIAVAETGLLTEAGLTSAIAAAQRLRKCAAAMETELRRQRRTLQLANATAAKDQARAERSNQAIMKERAGCLA